MTSETESGGLPEAPRVALRVGLALAEPLKAALLEQRFEVVAGDDLLALAEGRQAPLLICEVREDTEELAQRLLTDARDCSLVFIGPTGSETAAQRFNVRELSADVSVAEVVRVCQLLARGTATEAQWLAPPVSQPSMPYSVLPRVADTPGSLQPVAPLLPSSAPPSSRPASLRRAPSLPPALVDSPFAEEGTTRQSAEFSLELSQLLTNAEARVARSVIPRPGVPERDDPHVVVPLNAEILAALEDPIGDYDSLETTPPREARTPLPPSASWGSRARSQGRDHSPDSAPPDSVAPSSTGAPGGPGSTGPNSPFLGGTAPGHAAVPGGTAPGSSAPEHAPPGSAPLRSTIVGADALPSSRIPPGDATTVGYPSLEPKSFLDRSLAITPRPPSTRLPSAPATQAGSFGSDDSWGSPPISEPGDGPRSATPRTPETREPPPTRAARPVSSVPPQRPSDERITARPARRSSSIPPAPAIPRGSWLHAALDSSPSAPDPSRPSTRPPRATQLAEFAPESSLPREEPSRTAQPPASTPLGPAVSDLPPLRAGDAVALLASAIRSRFSGALAFELGHSVRRIVLRDGDFVTAASSERSESLLAHLVQQGTLQPGVESQLGHKIPNLGRHAAAALIASGHLRQDQLWPVLRAHAEALIARTLLLNAGAAAFEHEIPARLAAEPAVFGGATGAEVFIELVRRVIEPRDALERVGGERAEVRFGDQAALIDECALPASERAALGEIPEHGRAGSRSIEEILASAPTLEFPCVLYALVELHVLELQRGALRKPETATRRDALDEEALRRAVLARRALIDEGDYFAVLGVSHEATSYDVRRAYLELRRQFDPSVVLTPQTLDLGEDVHLILEVVTEAYEILSDQLRRDRYRRAIEALPA